MSNDSIANLKKIAYFIFDLFKGVILLFLLALLFRIFVFQPFIVDGPSMEPNYYDKEYLLVEKVTPKLKKYHRGDVVIFKYPQNQQLDFIKRIIGMPGETLQIENGKITIVNNEHPQGIILGETYLPSDIYSASTSTNFKVTLGQNQVFVMGDNRANSLDSRSFGALDEKLIIGKPMISFRNFHRILRPKYNVLLPKMKFLASK